MSTPRYQETIPDRRWWMFSTALFALLYLPCLGLRELRPKEALPAVVAGEMCEERKALPTTVHGTHLDSFPLYPWLISAASRFGRPTEATARLPAALAVLAMAGVCGYVASRAGGHLAGAVAASMVLTTAVTLGEGTRAGSDTVFALLISSAWFAWYQLGRARKWWNAAWCAALSLVLLATFDAGVKAVVLFYYPLLFLRRPLVPWNRMRLPGHVAALVGFAGVVAVWLWLSPEQVILPGGTQAIAGSLPAPTGGAVSRALAGFVRFPLECAAYLLPWPFLVWPGFCVAFRSVERTPVLCGYCRNLIYPAFITCWFLPGVSPKALLPILPPLAVLTGIHFEILVRRHYKQLAVLERLLLGAALVSGCTGLFFASAHLTGLVVFGGMSTAHWTLSTVLLVLAVSTARWSWHHGSRRPFWIRFVLATATLRLVYLAVLPCLMVTWRCERRLSGKTLAQSVPAQQRIWRLTPDPLVAECFHTGRPVRYLDVGQGGSVLQEDGPVYALAGPRPPILDLDNRTWSPCSPPVRTEARRRLRFLWRSGRGGLLTIEAVTPEFDSDAEIVRMYRGDMRPPGERPPEIEPRAGAEARIGSEREMAR